MSVRLPSGARKQVALTLCVILTLTGCRFSNVERIRHGRQYTADGERLQMVSLQPRCGRVSLTNPTAEPIWLESWFYAIPRGSMILPAGASTRILFDWAGENSSDFYELVAFGVVDPPGPRPQKDENRGFLIRDTLIEHAPLVEADCVDSQVNDSRRQQPDESAKPNECEFGSLVMDRAFRTTGGQERIATRQRGVNLSRVLEVSSPVNYCGCMMLRNVSATQSITLRATLNGEVTGQMEIPTLDHAFLAFDWAGPRDEVYVIEAIDVSMTPSVAPTPPSDKVPPEGAAVRRSRPPAAAPPPRFAVQLREYVSVVGQLVEMKCDPRFSEFQAGGAASSLPASGGGPSQTPGAKPTAPPQPGSSTAQMTAAPGTSTASTTIQCPWFPGLGMYRAFDPTGAKVLAGKAALERGAAAAAEMERKQ